MGRVCRAGEEEKKSAMKSLANPWKDSCTASENGIESQSMYFVREMCDNKGKNPSSTDVVEMYQVSLMRRGPVPHCPPPLVCRARIRLLEVIGTRPAGGESN